MGTSFERCYINVPNKLSTHTFLIILSVRMDSITLPGTTAVVAACSRQGVSGLYIPEFPMWTWILRRVYRILLAAGNITPT